MYRTHGFHVDPTAWSMEGLDTWMRGPSTHDMRVQQLVTDHKVDVARWDRHTTQYGDVIKRGQNYLEEITKSNLEKKSNLVIIEKRLKQCAHAVNVAYEDLDVLERQHEDLLDKNLRL